MIVARIALARASIDGSFASVNLMSDVLYRKIAALVLQARRHLQIDPDPAHFPQLIASALFKGFADIGRAISKHSIYAARIKWGVLQL